MDKMEYFGYLLSIKELYDSPFAETLVERACAKLDMERLRKVENSGQGKKRAQCIGAGLLLQLGLIDILFKECDKTNSNVKKTCKTSKNNGIRCITLADVLKTLGNPIEVGYSYGEHGKPCFRSIPFKFSISHSEENVLCVFSKQEIGADIQYLKPQEDKTMTGIVNRFFSEGERDRWEQIERAEDRADFFYRIWTRKEAYAKLTGEGILATVGLDLHRTEVSALGTIKDVTENLIWKTNEFIGKDEKHSKYYAAICKYSS